MSKVPVDGFKLDSVLRNEVTKGSLVYVHRRNSHRGSTRSIQDEARKAVHLFPKA